MPMNHRLLVPRASGFNPRSIAGLGLWLDASDAGSLTMNSSTVSEIRDKSGNARHFSQGTALNQPSLTTINGRNALDATAGNKLMTGNAASLTLLRNVPGATIFAVGRFGISASQTFFQANRNGATSARSLLGRLDSAGGALFGGRRLDADSFASVEYTAVETNQVYCGLLDYANSDAFIYESGTLKNSTTSFQTDGNTSDTDSQASSILCTTTLTVNHLNGVLAELLVWPRALTTAERRYIERGLGKKWGITVA